VKSGVLSGLDGTTPPLELWVDGHNNLGFSGGPLVFKPALDQGYRVVGVISSYRCSHLPVYNRSGQPIGVFPENSGIVVAHNIEFAKELIDRNPVGFPLKA